MSAKVSSVRRSIAQPVRYFVMLVTFFISTHSALRRVLLPIIGAWEL